MTWLELYRTLESELSQAEDGIAGKVERMPDLPSDEEAGQQQLAVNAACEHFARHRKWPRLDHGASWELYHRLLECLEFARFVAQPELPHRGEDRGIPDEKLLRWILIDYWAYAGIWRRIYGLEGGATSTA